MTILTASPTQWIESEQNFIVLVMDRNLEKLQSTGPQRVDTTEMKQIHGKEGQVISSTG